VAAGVVAKKLLASLGVEVAAWVSRVGPVALASAEELSLEEIRKGRDASVLGLAVADAGGLADSVNQLRSAGDSWGGAVECRVEGLPAGIGEPIFDKLGALLGHALLSLPAATAFEVGGGAHMSELPGSAIRDPIEQTAVGPRPASHRHGGLLGGMSTGLPLRVSVAFHAPTSIPRPISTVNKEGATQEIVVGGRHDAFPLPRALPMVEAMVAITLVDALLRAGRIPEKL
jgi:chorismate synthase